MFGAYGDFSVVLKYRIFTSSVFVLNVVLN